MTQSAESLGRARRLVDRASTSLARETPVAPRTLRPRWERQYAGLMPLGDLVITTTVALLCVWLLGVDPTVALLLALFWLVPLAVGGAYESRVLGQGTDEYK